MNKYMFLLLIGSFYLFVLMIFYNILKDTHLVFVVTLANYLVLFTLTRELCRPFFRVYLMLTLGILLCKWGQTNLCVQPYRKLCALTRQDALYGSSLGRIEQLTCIQQRDTVPSFLKWSDDSHIFLFTENVPNGEMNFYFYL